MSWIVEKSIQGGAQGQCDIVYKADNPGKVFFRKTINPNSNSERRRRFYLETKAYRSIDIQGVPKIVEDNSHLWESKEPLYFIAEYVEGKSLDKYIEENNLSEEEIISLNKQLFIILKQLHKYEIVHRDIKPENIVISTDGKLYLVDFGISYVYSEEDLAKTSTGQEIGNRFLRLPEFSAGSLQKRDYRSDITSACAVLLYCITKKYPRVLANEKGEFPHQHYGIANRIKALKKSILWNAIFDRAFQHDIEKRWQNSQDLINILESMNNQNEDTIDKNKKILEAYFTQMDSTFFKTSLLIQPSNHFHKLLVEVANRYSKGFHHGSLQFDNSDALADFFLRGHYFKPTLQRPASKYIVFLTTQLVGMDIVFYIQLFSEKNEKIEVFRYHNSQEISASDTEIILERLDGIISEFLASIVQSFQ